MDKNVTHHANKGSQQQFLPSRHVLNTLTKGDPSQRTVNNYAKATPSVVETGPSIEGTEP